jgi:transcriptional regulator with XRE-family HTH domain
MENNGKDKSSSVVPARWNQEFAKRLVKRRKELNLEQQDLADKSGVKLRTIQNYESGGSPSAKFVISLADALKCTTGWLLMGEGLEPGESKKKVEHGKSVLYKVVDNNRHVADLEDSAPGGTTNNRENLPVNL